MNAALASACPVIIDTFQLVQPDDVDRILGEVNATHQMCDVPLPFLAYNSSQRENARVCTGSGKCLLTAGYVPRMFKGSSNKRIIEKLSLDPSLLDNYWPV